MQVIDRPKVTGVPGNGLSSAPTPNHERRISLSPWSLILGLIVVTAVVSVIVSRARVQAALPAGLIQVNGRMEGDLVSISSKYAGRISALLAREGDSVTRGQTIVRLDDDESRARLAQAEAAIQEAQAQASGATTGVGLTSDTTGAQVVQAQGMVNQMQAGVESARADALRAEAAVITARATARAADAAVLVAQAGLETANVARSRADTALESAKAQSESAQASTRAAEASADAARATNDNNAQEAIRYATLLKQGAVSAEIEGQVSSAGKASQAQVNAAQQQIVAARAFEQQRRAEQESARQQVLSADAGIRQARAQVAAAREQSAAAWAAVRQSLALQASAEQSVNEAQARGLQAEGQMKQARTAPAQIAVSRASREQARARIAQAIASARELRSTLNALFVTAPVTGTVTTRYRDVGEVVTAGAPLLDVVDLDRLYLKVFVPENEIGHVRLGCPARIYLDSFPGEYFAATVTYIASTAEFTPKEVQTPDERTKLVYAVKLTVQSNPEHKLTPGMPADAIIRWKPGIAWEKPRW